MATRPPANITNRSRVPMAEPLHVSGGMGGQPSISDRDPGDENRPECQWHKHEFGLGGDCVHCHKVQQVVVPTGYVAALEAENAKLRADLAQWSRSQTVPEGSFW